MTVKDLVNNFVSQFNRPFDLNMISNLIDRDPEEVKAVLVELLTAEQIRLVDPDQGIYVRNNRYLTSVCYHQKGNWQFDPIAANALLDHIEQGKYFTIREVAKDFPRSRQWVYVYLEALASMEFIGYGADGYRVITRNKLSELGKKVIPSAISKMMDDYFASSHEFNRPPRVRKTNDEKLKQSQAKKEQRRTLEKARRQAIREERDRKFRMEMEEIEKKNQEACERLAKRCNEHITRLRNS